jgi:hypothetical protein
VTSLGAGRPDPFAIPSVALDDGRAIGDIP